MAFVLPTFNLTVNLWRTLNPTTNPPDLVFQGQLRAPNQTSATVNPTTALAAGPYLLCPPLTDIRDRYTSPISSDTIEVPAGSGRFYSVLLVDDVAKGFTNEHRYAILTKQPGWHIPIP